MRLNRSFGEIFKKSARRHLCDTATKSKVTFQIVGELKDIELCMLALNRVENLSGVLHFMIWFIQFARRWIFLTALTCAVPILVGFRGGDALSVCFVSARIDDDSRAHGFATTCPSFDERLRAADERRTRLR